MTQYNRHVLANCVGSSSLLTGPGVVAMKGLITAMANIVNSVKHFCWIQELLASNSQEVFSGSFQQDCQRLVKGCRCFSASKNVILWMGILLLDRFF